MISSKKFVRWIALVVVLVLLLYILYSTYLILGSFNKQNNIIDAQNQDSNIDIKNVSTIEIILDKTNLVLKEGLEFKIDTDNKGMLVNNIEGKLLVSENKNIVDFSNKKNHAIITIPKEFKNIIIKNVSGITKIEDLNAETLNIEIATGECLIENVKVDKSTNFSASIGKGVFNNSTFNNFNLNLGVGETRINSKLRGECKVKSNVGNTQIVFLDGLENYTITTKKGIGFIEVEENEVKDNTTIGNGKNKVLIEGGLGNISII